MPVAHIMLNTKLFISTFSMVDKLLVDLHKKCLQRVVLL